MNKAALSTYSDLELALMVMLGYYGNGTARKIALGNRYNQVQSLVQKIIDSGSVPAGGGTVDSAKLSSAVQKVFNDAIKDIEEEIIKNYGT